MSPIDDSDKMARRELVKQAMREVLQETNGAVKDMLKEALREWMDEKFAAFGRWSIYGILASILGGIAWAILVTKGWTPPK